MSSSPAILSVMTNDAERIHAALTLAANTASAGRPVMVFYSKAAVTTLLEGGVSDAARAMDDNLVEKGLADSAVLIDAMQVLPVRFIVCADTLLERGIKVEQLASNPACEIMTLVEVMEEGRGGDWLTF